MSIKICPKCNIQHTKLGKFCSRSCANSRGPRSEEFKKKVSAKLQGKNYTTPKSIRAGIISRGLIPRDDKPNTFCVVCQSNTQTKYRKTCSDSCYKKLAKLQSQKNPKCGGQKTTHRSKIANLKNEIFVSESSFEVKLSKIFNALNIYWIRPNYFWYTDKYNNKRRYYPDFYLPEYNLYFDPKNDYLIKTDIDKIVRTSKENDITIVVLGEKYLTHDTIKELVGDEGNAPSLPACKTGTLLLS